jgi:guanylate kinase
MFINYDPFIIIISSPSGAGKTTICRMIVNSDPSIKLSISATTRKKRPQEISGQDYFFVSDEDFLSMKNSQQFLEDALVFNNLYGSPKKTAEEEIKKGNCVLFDIDWQGARQIKEKLPKEMVISIFILPPSLQELERRLRARAQDSEEIVAQRMQEALQEISHYNEYDFVLINDDLENSLKNIRAIIETKRISRQNVKELIETNNFLKK